MQVLEDSLSAKVAVFIFPYYATFNRILNEAIGFLISDNYASEGDLLSFLGRIRHSRELAV